MCRFVDKTGTAVKLKKAYCKVLLLPLFRQQTKCKNKTPIEVIGSKLSFVKLDFHTF